MNRTIEIGLRAAALAGWLAFLLAGHAWAIWPWLPPGVVLGQQAWDPQTCVSPCSDGHGGAIVLWQEVFWIDPDLTETTSEVRAQYVDSSGTERWPSAGRILHQVDWDELRQDPVIVSDGAGGAIAAWRGGLRHDPDTDSIFVQRVNGAGALLWAARGVAIGVAGGSSGTRNIAACEDGSGGAIVVWVNEESGVYVLRTQRVSAGGAALWAAGGVLACTSAGGNSPKPALCSDGAGGAYVVWTSASTTDVYVQHLGSGGTRDWGSNGGPLGPATGTQRDPSISPDGSGGALIAMASVSGTTYSVYACRVNQTYIGWWGALQVASPSSLTPSVCGDGTGGALIAFQYGSRIHVQRVSAEGVLMWPANGMSVCSAAGTRSGPRIVSDRAGGGIVAWVDSRSGRQDVYARCIDGNGTPRGTADGDLLSNSPQHDNEPVVIEDGKRGAIVTYVRHDSVAWGMVSEGVAQRVDHFGVIGDPTPRLAWLADTPGDQGGSLTATWYLIPHELTVPSSIAAYWLWRQVPAAAALAGVEAGGRWLDPAEEFPSIVVVKAPLYRRTTSEGTTAYWEFVQSIPATGASSYVASVPTPSTRCPGIEPYTVVLLQARAASGPGWWDAPPDSAIAIDNLGPPVPSPFTATYAGGRSWLHWQVGYADDYAYCRLHRGSSASFVPNLANRVAELADTAYVDSAGAPYYYKIASVDVHGTTSTYALAQPQGTVEVPPGVTRIALEIVGANPVDASHAAVRIDLPDRAPTRLDLLDVSGRRLGHWDLAGLGAGSHTVSLGRCRGLPPGIYLLRLGHGEQSVTRRLAVLR